jgi:peptide/nickel transport system permease protein
MINAARLEMAREPMVWWALFAAFSFMFALVLSANLFADAVQNAFDPRVKTLSARVGALRRKKRREASGVKRAATGAEDSFSS